MTDTTDKVAFAAAELNAASDALVSAAAEVDALRAELARQAGIAVDHCARADAAERARDEVGIQLAAAQAEIARMRPVVEAARTMSAMWLQDSPRMTDYHVTLASALAALDAVPGDALAPRINAALEASGIDSAVVQWEKRAEKAWSERDAALSTMLTLRAEVARLTAEVEAMRAVVEEADRVYTTCEPNAPMLVQHLGECLDALRARKVGG